MREPTFSFKDTRLEEAEPDGARQGRSRNDDGIFGSDDSFQPPSFQQTYSRYPTQPRRAVRPSKSRNWILPPAPEALGDEGGRLQEKEKEKEIGGDLLSRTQAIYEGAYTRERDEEGEPAREGSDEEGDEMSYDPSYDSDNAMGLLLPGSGLALAPVIGPLGAGPPSGEDAIGMGSDGTSTMGQDLFDGAGGLALAAANEDFEAGFETDPFMFVGSDNTGDEMGSPDEEAGLPMTRNLLASFGANAEEGAGAPTSYAPTHMRSEGLGNWRKTFSSMAAAMHPSDRQVSSSAGAFTRPESMRSEAGTGLFEPVSSRNVMGEGLRDSFGWSGDTSAGGSLFTEPAGSGFESRRTADAGSFGGSTIGGFGTGSDSSFGSFASPTPSSTDRGSSFSSFGSGTSFGSGIRSGVRATEDIPNPLGRSLFD